MDTPSNLYKWSQFRVYSEYWGNAMIKKFYEGGKPGTKSKTLENLEKICMTNTVKSFLLVEHNQTKIIILNFTHIPKIPD